MRRTATRLLTATAAAALGLLVAVPGAVAAGDGTVDHAQLDGSTLKLLVSVPGDAEVDLDSVAVTVGGTDVDATASLAASSDEVERTAVLAIDTSNSMAGRRITEARKAARTFLDAVPANVAVGIVTFDDEVVVRQEPTRDRDASRRVVDGLALSLGTSLYEGVRTAVETTGDAGGQRQVLVLSDGQDSTGDDLQPVLDTISGAGVKVDVVSLEQGAEAPEPLRRMAEGGHGTVVSASDASALEQAFSSEADVLARQVLVTATVPADQEATDATVAVSLDAGGSTHTAEAFVAVKDPKAPAATSAGVSDTVDGGFSVPQPLVYLGVLAIGAGLIGLVIALAGPTTLETKVPLADQLQVYTAGPPAPPTKAQLRAQLRANQAASTTLAEQARQAAANVLSSNAGMEAKIAARLEAAGMALKSSEWLLMHLGIAFGAGIVGLLISGGNPLLMLLFLVLGSVGPWVYLDVRRARRLKAFSAGLADTLQLMSGSLSAGLSLAQSMDTIVREGTEPITSEFKRAIVESRLGVSLEDALEGVAQRMQSDDFTWVVMAIRIQREVGGNLAELLLTVANTLREREYLRRHVRALSAEGRLSCWILGALPPVFLLYLTLAKPAYVKPMYTTPIGWLMCAAMGILLSVGIFWMSKVAKVEV